MKTNDFVKLFSAKKINYDLFLILIIVLAFIIRIYGLDQKSFYYDEAVRMLFAKNYHYLFFNIPSFMQLYIFILNLFLKAGLTEYWIRILSVIFSLLSIFFIYRLSSKLFNRETGLIGSFLMAISPVNIYYSREVTVYSIIILLALISVYTFYLSINSCKKRYWFLYLFCTVVMVYLHLFTFTLVISEIIFFVFFYKNHKKCLNFFLFSQLLILILSGFIFLLNFYENHTTVTANIFSITTEMINIIRIFNTGFKGNYFLLCMILPVYLFILRNTLFGTKNYKTESKGLILFSFIIPLILIFSSIFFIKIFLYRYMLFIMGFYYILLAIGISGFNKNIKIYLLVAIYTFSILSLKNYEGNNSFKVFPATYPETNYKEISYYILDNYKTGDLILQTSFFTMPSLIYYTENKGLNPNILAFTSQNEKELVCFSFEGTKKDFSGPRKFTDNNKGISDIIRLLYQPIVKPYKIYKGFNYSEFLFKPENVQVKKHKRIWLVYLNISISEKVPLVPQPISNMEVSDYLKKDFHLIFIKNFRICNIGLYSENSKEK